MVIVYSPENIDFDALQIINKKIEDYEKAAVIITTNRLIPILAKKKILFTRVIEGVLHMLMLYSEKDNNEVKNVWNPKFLCWRNMDNIK